MSEEGTGAARAAEARGAQVQAHALWARAAAAVDRVGTLYAATCALRATAQEARTRAAELRVLTAARRREHWRSVVATLEPPAAGRVVRRPVRHRRAAATAGPPPPERTPPGAPWTPDGRWADATVYATRTIVGSADGAGGEGAATDGVVHGKWTVRELDARALPGARGARCLVFENEVLVRRVWDYPAAWLTWPAAALLQLAGLGP
jgi:hypothetical protein